MSTAETSVSLENALTIVKRTLRDAPLPAVDLSAEPFTDGLGEDAWRLIVVLPRPAGQTWKVEDVFRVRREATRAFDAAIAGTSLTLPGLTLAVVTTHDSDPKDIALDEVPEEDEDPRRTWSGE